MAQKVAVSHGRQSFCLNMVQIDNQTDQRRRCCFCLEDTNVPRFDLAKKGVGRKSNDTAIVADQTSAVISNQKRTAPHQLQSQGRFAKA